MTAGRDSGMVFANPLEAEAAAFAAVEVIDDLVLPTEDAAMLSSVQIRPIHIVCDAPPYEVVKGSERLGLRSPEDVRWRRQSVASSEAGRRKSLAGRLWRLLFAFGLPDIEEKCGCGGTLPERRFIRLRTLAGSEIRYALAQCDRCRTIVWDEK